MPRENVQSMEIIEEVDEDGESYKRDPAKKTEKDETQKFYQFFCHSIDGF